MKIILITALLIFISGCARNRCTESLTIPLTINGQQVAAEYKSEVTQTLWLYFTKTKQIERTTPLSTLLVGDTESGADPNSIDAMGGFAGSILDKILTKGL